ncbi:ribonuclease R [Croceicoccus sp. F390]|uniref:Ribonuclease R n=2 Tax=Croceicoccus esteveae TaxID=3075597 RepID=A0ABU2ZG09_9SPHN|nr:ribonuclease R [Croceicoccus sp. F390]MDT0575529.1 ribonuclease R [Croceicoccus sp. F390]
MKATPPHPALPSQKQVLDFIGNSPTPAGKREIARHFGLKGQDKIALKAMLRDMAEEGLIDGGNSAFQRMGGVPKVTVLKVTHIEEGEAIAVPESWSPDSGEPAPRLRVVDRKTKGKRPFPALRKGDRVLARTEETGTGWRAHVMKKLPDAETAMMGVVEIDRTGKAWLAPVEKSVRNSVAIADVGGARDGQLVLAEPVAKSARAGMKVVEVLGNPLAPKAFSLIAIHKYDIPFVFPPEVQDAAQHAAALPLLADQREDLRHLPIVAIDPADARDHDDAIWAAPDDDPANAGGWRAIVAIADVSYYVRPGSAIDNEARKRGNSVYFPDRVVPMLPEVLSADVCSLREGEPRAAMACHLRIDAQGRIRDHRFTRAIVQIAEVIAYEDAQARIDDGTALEPLTNLWACWERLNSARTGRDPLDLDLPERRVMLDEQGRISEIAVRERLDAHRVVEDFMIAANVAAAKALESKVAPVMYRIHETPSREKLMALKEYLATLERNFTLGQVITPGIFNRLIKDTADDTERMLIMEQVLRTQTQAYYGPANAGHFGLALGSYAHFTSPIRRYADLLVHRALVDAFALEQARPLDTSIPARSGLSDKDRAALDGIADAISKTERRAMEAERDTIDRYVAAWLSGRVGEIFDTRVTGVQKFGLFATIIGFGGDGLLPISTLGDEYFTYDEKAQLLKGSDTGTQFAVGDRLKLRLAEANPLSGALKFELPASEGSVEPRGRKIVHKGKARSGTTQGPRGRPANIRHSNRKR